MIKSGVEKGHSIQELGVWCLRLIRRMPACKWLPGRGSRSSSKVGNAAQWGKWEINLEEKTSL